MYLLIVLFLAFIVFMFLYARYTSVSGDIRQRRMRLDNLRDDIEFRIAKLQKGNAQIRHEIADASTRLQDLKDTYESLERDGDEQ